MAKKKKSVDLRLRPGLFNVLTVRLQDRIV